MEERRRIILQEIVGPRYDLDCLSEPALHVLDSFQSAYNCSPAPLLQGAGQSGDVDLTQDTYFRNIGSLFNNGFVRERLLSAQGAIFSRPHLRKSSEQRFQEALSMIAQEIATTHGDKPAEYYTELAPLSELSARLESYVRAKPTPTSTRVCRKLKKIVDFLTPHLQETEMTVHLLGSCLYGDAAPTSDIDVNYIILSEGEESLDDRREDLITSIEAGIEGTDETQKIDLSLYQSIMKDIIEGETTEANDYECTNRLFHPYDWLLQGKDLSTQQPFRADIEEARTLLRTAAEQDPFFEFLLSFSLIQSIQKRKENSVRR